MKPHKNQGNSLIEVLVAITVIGIGLLSVYAIFTLNLRATTRANHMSTAYQLMNKKMEEVRSTEFNSLAVGTTTQTITSLPSGSQTTTIATYTPQGGSPDANLKKVTVQVSWQERQANQQVAESTLVTPGGINE